MKDILTLSKDIYHVLDHTQEHEPLPECAEEAAGRIANELLKSTNQRSDDREAGKLWASDLGKPCLRQHYYKFNEPEIGEKLDGHTKFKFLYGNLLEESVLWLAQESGHDVRACQQRVEVDHNGWKISGRIDAIIDNVLVDVKSTSSYGYKKYTSEGITPANDSFGYLEQLGFYAGFSGADFTDTGFVWIDKQNGHVTYQQADVPDKDALLRRADDIITAIEGTEFDTPRAFNAKPFGKSGNMQLDIGCSYCPFKQHCWRDANAGQGLRTFIYSHGPVYMTEVYNTPKVYEVDDD